MKFFKRKRNVENKEEQEKGTGWGNIKKQPGKSFQAVL